MFGRIGRARRKTTSIKIEFEQWKYLQQKLQEHEAAVLRAERSRDYYKEKYNALTAALEKLMKENGLTFSGMLMSASSCTSAPLSERIL